MAHFNPAVTLGFLITKHITKKLLLLYITAEITGALLASVFVKYVIGTQAYLGANAPNYSYPLTSNICSRDSSLCFTYGSYFSCSLYKGFERIWWIGNWWHRGIDIFFLAFISGASMNPARSLAPALLSGVLGNLWLYWTATFIGTTIMAFIFNKKIFNRL